MNSMLEKHCYKCILRMIENDVVMGTIIQGGKNTKGTREQGNTSYLELEKEPLRKNTWEGTFSQHKWLSEDSLSL